MEVRALEAIYNKHSIPFMDATDMSIEEISTRILAAKGLKRRLQ
jgi:regulator of PEP synthase PpsR (kinase-PPPase family)